MGLNIVPSTSDLHFQSASSDNLTNLASKSLPVEKSKVSPSTETKTAAVPEVKQPEPVSCEPSTSTESNCSDSEISKITTLSTDTGNSSLPTTTETDSLVGLFSVFEFSGVSRPLERG